MSDTTEKKKNGIKDTFDSIIVAFVIAMIIRTFIFQAYKIPTGSMLDTLLIGDHILVNKLAYIASKPKVDDIIVFEYPLDPSKDYIKRVIGIPGDDIRIEDKKVYRNNELIISNFTRFESTLFLPIDLSPRDSISTFAVPEGTYFVMGDNRDSSFDSRFWGFVDERLLVGKAAIIYWSWDSGDNGDSVRFNRIGKLIN